MGGFFSKVWTKLFKSAKELKLMMIGLDFAGKTTILIRMQTGEKASSTRPTIGFNLEQINFKNFKLKVWDLSGQEKLRAVWKHYYQNVNGIIFVIDSSDRKRISDVRDEFQRVISEHDIQSTRMLVIANKQDLEDAMRENEIKDILSFPSEYDGRIKIQEASALNNVGLVEGFAWLVSEIELLQSKKAK